MISAKVANGSLTGLATGLVTWALTYFIPAWKSGIPPALAPLVPALVAIAGYFAAGYLSRHKATAGEIARALAELEAISGAVAAHPAAKHTA